MSYEVEFKGLIEKLENNPRKWCAVGMRTMTTEDVEGLKLWLETKNIEYRHDTHYKSGSKLPHQGVLHINPSNFSIRRKV